MKELLNLLKRSFMVIKAIVNWLRKSQMDPVEKYLAQSTDLVDLERRQKELMFKGKYWI